MQLWNYPLLYSLQGFRYCDLLLARAERVAGSGRDARALSRKERDATRSSGGRTQTLMWAESQKLATRHCPRSPHTRSRSALPGDPGWSKPQRPRRQDEIEKGVAGLRAAGTVDLLPSRSADPVMVALRQRRRRGSPGRPRRGARNRRAGRDAALSGRRRPLPGSFLRRPRGAGRGAAAGRGMRLWPPFAGDRGSRGEARDKALGARASRPLFDLQAKMRARRAQHRARKFRARPRPASAAPGSPGAIWAAAPTSCPMGAGLALRCAVAPKALALHCQPFGAPRSRAPAGAGPSSSRFCAQRLLPGPNRRAVPLSW